MVESIKLFNGSNNPYGRYVPSSPSDLSNDG